MKQIASLLICALILLTAGPAKSFAQTRYANNELNLRVAQAKPNAGLSIVFTEGIAKIKAARLTTADFRRLEKERLYSQSTAKPGSGFSKKEKILAVVILLGITALAIVLAHNGVDPKPSCEEQPGAPDCIQ